VAEGGLAIALAEACITGPGAGIGGHITLAESLRGSLRFDTLLFGESQSRVLVSLPAANVSQLRALAQTASVACTVLGEVGGTALDIAGMIQLPVAQLQHEWRTALAQQIGL
jgi:phosphoribosylformylglycinamidine synthase